MFRYPILIKYLQRFIVLFTAITVHEFSHGFVADRLGDPTARNSGRLTLNPLSHLDPIGALCMILFKFGWAKPVPFNPFYFRNRKRDTALVSLAGPASNILLAFASTIIYVPFVLFVYRPFTNALTWFVVGTLQSLVYLNIAFAVFNMIPIPPLDGSKILGTILPNSTYMKLLQYERYGFFVLILLSYTGILSRILDVFIQPVYDVWGVFVEFFLRMFG